MVTRYDDYGDGIEDYPEGDLVKYDDYKALKDAADTLVSVIVDEVDYGTSPINLRTAVSNYRKLTK